MATYMNQNKNKQCLTYKDKNDDGQQQSRYDEFKLPSSRQGRQRGDSNNQFKNYDQDEVKGREALHSLFETQSEKNEFSSVTDLLNRQDHNKGLRQHDY